MKPAHESRPGPARVRVVTAADPADPPGHFTEPVRLWMPGFVSQLQIDPATKRFASEYAIARQHRRNGGFDSHPLGLPGALTDVRVGGVDPA